MADKTDDGSKDNEQLSLTLRMAVANAYSYVKGQESVQSFSSFTFEDAMDSEIERISGQDSQLRPNAINRIAQVQNAIVSAATQIKSLPPGFFNDPDTDTDVNTPA